MHFFFGKTGANVITIYKNYPVISNNGKIKQEIQDMAIIIVLYI